MLATHQLNRLPAAERGITIADFLVPIRVGERISARIRHIALDLRRRGVHRPDREHGGRLPGNPVPITGQTLSVLVVGGALGLRRGGMSVALYLVLGLFLPVYAGPGRTAWGRSSASARAASCWAPVGGYSSASCSPAALVGWLAEMGWDRHIRRRHRRDDPGRGRDLRHWRAVAGPRRCTSRPRPRSPRASRRSSSATRSSSPSRPGSSRWRGGWWGDAPAKGNVATPTE